LPPNIVNNIVKRFFVPKYCTPNIVAEMILVGAIVVLFPNKVLYFRLRYLFSLHIISLPTIMTTLTRFLPGFKATCLTVGIVDVFLAGSLFARGLMQSLAEFKVPAEILASPHYFDAMLWVYVHMIVIGLIIGCVGYYADATNLLLQKRLSVLLFVVHLFYTYLDFRSSDSALGNGLYQGAASVFPAVISLVITLLFLQLVIALHSGQKRPLASGR